MKNIEINKIVNKILELKKIEPQTQEIKTEIQKLQQKLKND